MKKQYKIIRTTLIWVLLTFFILTLTGVLLTFFTPAIIALSNLKRYTIIEFYTNPVTYLIINSLVLIALGLTVFLLVSKDRLEYEKWQIEKDEEIRKAKAEKDNEQYHRSLEAREQSERYKQAVKLMKYLYEKDDELPNAETLERIKQFISDHMYLSGNKTNL